MKKNIKPVLTTIEHFVLFGLIVGGATFYIGVQYGQSHTTVKAAISAQNASQAPTEAKVPTSK